ncbi:MAG: histidine phosphatase family protein [Pseudomonadota bacterium]
MPRLIFITHADVAIDPAVPVPDWSLSEIGRARHRAFSDNPILDGVETIYSSTERKAIEGAAILAEARRVPRHEFEALHENDRSATGYLPKAKFEAVADAFFERPEESVRGWERAIDAQARVVTACRDILSGATGDVAVVAHGGIGALLVCDALGVPISRDQDQPPTGGGNYCVVSYPEWSLIQAWTDIAPRETLP